MKHFRTALRTLKTLRGFGITFADICAVIDFDALLVIANRLDLSWLKLVVTVARSLCSLAPENQQFVIDFVEGIDIDQLT